MKIKKVQRIDRSDSEKRKIEYYLTLENGEHLTYTAKCEWGRGWLPEIPDKITNEELEDIRRVFDEEILLEFTDETKLIVE